MGLWRPLERWSFSAVRGKTPFLCLSWSGQVDSAQQPTPRGKYVHMQYVCRKYVANFLLTQEFQAICSQLVLVLCWWNILRRCCCVALTGPELTAVLLRPIPPLVYIYFNILLRYDLHNIKCKCHTFKIHSPSFGLFTKLRHYQHNLILEHFYHPTEKLPPRGQSFWSALGSLPIFLQPG